MSRERDAQRLQELFGELLEADEADPLRCIASLAAAQFGQERGEGFTEVVSRVLDGDTIMVKHRGVDRRIRLWGLDCPEDDQPFGEVATNVTRDLAEGRIATLTPIEVDCYQRLVAVVALRTGEVLNHSLVEAVAAWWYSQYAGNDRVLPILETAAREARRGLWADPAAVAPWDWRRAHKVKT